MPREDSAIGTGFLGAYEYIGVALNTPLLVKSLRVRGSVGSLSRAHLGPSQISECIDRSAASGQSSTPLPLFRGFNHNELHPLASPIGRTDGSVYSLPSELGDLPDLTRSGTRIPQEVPAQPQTLLQNCMYQNRHH